MPICGKNPNSAGDRPVGEKLLPQKGMGRGCHCRLPGVRHARIAVSCEGATGPRASATSKPVLRRRCPYPYRPRRTSVRSFPLAGAGSQQLPWKLWCLQESVCVCPAPPTPTPSTPPPPPCFVDDAGQRRIERKPPAAMDTYTRAIKRQRRRRSSRNTTMAAAATAVGRGS
jgi:hypothetical protein